MTTTLTDKYLHIKHLYQTNLKEFYKETIYLDRTTILEILKSR